MKVPYSWLREHLPLEISPEDLASHLLMIGFEVAQMRKTGPAFSGVVVAEILEIQKHPNADRLSLCSVNDGQETLSVVCGAKNIAVGQRVPLAAVGAKLPGGTIERSKIRGVESNGMLCSTKELGLEGDASGIKLLPADAPLGKDVGPLFFETDAILDVEVASNRPDCLSVYGLARELGIYFRQPVKPAAPPAGPPAGAPSSPVSIGIEDKAGCARYIGRYFESVKVGPSPAWMARRLEAVGLRPINALVDITNYVLLELGHPLHVFDAEKLRGNQLLVRRARPGESIKALDGRTYALAEEDLVIADAQRPVAIAGVMGGEEAGVTEKTTRVLLEAAQFAPARVRRTSQRLKLRSDSSYRFERGTAPQTAALAAARAADLIRQLAGATEHRMVDVYPSPEEPSGIPVSAQRLNQILGTRHEPDKVEGILRSMADKLIGSADAFTLIPPAYRLDLKTVSDVAEEIGRHLGYDSIPSETAPVKLQRPKTLPSADRLAELRSRLCALGFFEAYNYDFLSPAELKRSGLDAARAPELLNPISEDWAYLRPSLLPGLLRSAAYNFRRGARGVRLFEAGKAYEREGQDGREVAERAIVAGLLAGVLPERPDWTERRQPLEPDRLLFEAKGACAELLEGLAVEWREGAADPLLHPKAAMTASLPGRDAARVGLLHPSVAQAWDIPAGAAVFVLDLDALAATPRAATKLKPVSPFPSIVRDLSLVVPETTRFAALESCLRGLPALIRLDLIDRLAGKEAQAIGLPPGKAGLTVRLTFGLADRTLRDEEVGATIHKGVAELGARCGATLRA